MTRAWKWDNLIGQLSYPVYLSHVPMIEIARRLDVMHIDKGLLGVILTIALSAMLYAFIDRPVEHVRTRIGGA